MTLFLATLLVFSVVIALLAAVGAIEASGRGRDRACNFSCTGCKCNSETLTDTLQETDRD